MSEGTPEDREGRGPDGVRRVVERLRDKVPPEVKYELRLSVALRDVLKATCNDGDTPAEQYKPLTLGLIVDTTGERAFGVLMAFLCLPLLSPIPLPGLSVPFGLALLLLGAQLAVRKHRPWLPRKMLRLRLPAKFGPRLIAFVAKIFRPLEKVVRPRLLFMQNGMAMLVVGLALMVDGFVLALPLPIPGTNAVPAWMALIKILGITEEDGVALLLGTVLTGAGVVALVVFVLMGGHGMMHWWR